MIATSLTLTEFRNYADCSLEFDPGVNIICGANAQGKTNLLEGLFFASNLKSFRSANKKDVIRMDRERMRLDLCFDAFQREHTVELALPRQGSLQMAADGVKKKRQYDLIGFFRTVLFCPEDLYLVREGAAARRRFLDVALCQLRPNYAKYLEEYQRLLQHKSKILKHAEEKPSLLLTLDDFTRRMAYIGSFLVRYRAYFIRKLEAYAAEMQLLMSGKNETLSLEYQTVSTIADPLGSVKEIEAALLCHGESHRAAEIAAKSCLSGPHKDDMAVLLNGVSARGFGSQGQIRTAVLALKLSEREMFYQDSGEYPVLLLDDVLSELDGRRQDFVLNQIQGGQVFITCCEEEKFGDIRSGKRFFVESGQVFPGKS